MSEQNSARFFSTQLPALLTLIALVFYAWFIYQNALNAPYQDDIFDVLKPVTDFLQAETFREGWSIIYAQHNDHRTLSSRLAYLLQYTISGDLDFRTLTFMANGALLLIAVLLFSACRTQAQRWLLFLPVALLLFQLRAYGIALWVMAAFAYFYVYAWAYVALFSLQRPGPLRFLLALVSAALATFSLASGQMVWLVGAACLAYQVWKTGELASAYFWAWLATAVLVLGAYNVGLDQSINTPEMLIGSFLADPLKYLLYYLALLGSAFSLGHLAPAIVTGVFIAAAVILIAIRNWRREYRAIDYCCAYCLITVAIMVIGRAPYSELEYALQSRYSFPSTVAIISTWVALATMLQLRSKPVLAFAATLACAYAAYSWTTYYNQLAPYTRHRYESFNRGFFWAYGYPIKQSRGVVEQAIDAGVYAPPERPLPLPPEVSFLKGEEPQILKIGPGARQK